MRIGVIGAGVMGSGVAQLFASKGHSVAVVDLSEDAFAKSKASIKNSIRFAGMFSRGEKLNAADVLARVSYSTNYDGLSEADFVIESVTENVNVKRGVYERLEQSCGQSCVYMANTSCVSITKIGSFTCRADRVIGTHFMNPVPAKQAAEVIMGWRTSRDTLERVSALLNGVGVSPIVVNDYPGFVSNRISHLLMNEAVWVVQDGVAKPEDVDAIFKRCFEHKMGPLETADLIGLDVVLDSLDVLFASYNDTKFRAAPLLRKMVDAGLLGRKCGEGFYKYD